MNAPISTILVGSPIRRPHDRTASDVLSQKEFRELVEVLRARNESFFVVAFQSASREDARRLLVEINKTGGKNSFLGSLGRNRLGVLGQDVQLIESVRRWADKHGGDQRNLRIFHQSNAFRDLETRREWIFASPRRIPAGGRRPLSSFAETLRNASSATEKETGDHDPLSYFADTGSLPQRILTRRRLRRRKKRQQADVTGDHQIDQPETILFAAKSLSVYDLYKIPTPLGKRCFDIIIATLILILASPVLGLAAALIKSTSPGPLFFVQERLGHGGKCFRMYKFRTMYADAEGAKRRLLSENEMDGSAFKMRYDPRVTPVGIWLRRFSIDEIPQLWNVIRGDMSLVGPRPLPSADWQPQSVRESFRHDVAPGLTCIWQVRGRNEIGWEDWVRMDLFYVRKRCWSLDMKILLATIPAVISQRGAC